ncbi:MAG TPA: hypothetical protein VHV77_14160, partial [Pirellulales bacterium]|nr:hypothetical protein [Pirellulales bacterium]
WSLCAAVVIGCLATPARAETPWQKMTLFKKIESNPNNTYQLSENQGPWLIMAYAFSGETAKDDARELVHELRSVYKLSAYSHEMVFDFQAGTMGKGVDRYGGARKMKYRVTKSQEVAVLIGDFMTLDDPQARKTLEQVRRLPCECLSKHHDGADAWQKDRSIKGWRALQQSITRDPEKQGMGPMQFAFMVSNPLIPDDYFKPKGLDKMVVDMNKPLKYSLLHCPGRYTVRVATYTPPAIPIIGHDKQKEAQALKCVEGTLEEAAEKAHKLCEALRAKGYEAYEFHDRHTSIVTVGSFDSVGTPRADGKIEINPQIHLIMSTFGANKTLAPGQAPVVGNAKEMASIKAKFDVQPMPVEVPKATISAAYMSVAR